MKWITGLSLQSWLLLIGITGMLVFLVTTNRTKVELVKAKSEMALQAIQIADQSDAIVTTKKIAVINSVTQVAIQMAVKEASGKHAGLQQKVEQQSAAVVHSFTDLPVTIECTNQEQQQLSTIRINGLWEAYCAAVPDIPSCQSPLKGEVYA